MTDNRILNALEAVQGRIRSLPDEKIAAMEAAATLDIGDWAFLGDKASLALAEGRLNQEEAATLHDIHTRFRSSATLVERMVFMVTMQELSR